MKYLTILCFLFLPILLFSQTAVLPNGTLIMNVLNSKRERVKDVFVLINKRLLNPCDSCFSYYDQGGLYYLKDSGFQNNTLMRAFVEIRHPDYLPFSDTVFLHRPIILRKPGQSYCYMGNKIPGVLKSEYSVAYLYGNDDEEMFDLINSFGGTIINSYSLCDDKFSSGAGPTKLIIKHINALMAYSFQENVKNSGSMFSDNSKIEDGMSFTRKLYISCFGGAEQANKIIEMTQIFIRNNWIKSARITDGFGMINPQVEVVFNPAGISISNEYIEQMQSTGIVSAEMEIFMWPCPG